MPHAALLLVHGDENFLIDRAVHEWRRSAAAAQMDVEVFDAPARLLELRRSVSELPLIDPERAILVRDAPQLHATARRGADGADALAALLAERAPTTSICLVAHTRVSPQHPVIAALRDLGGEVRYFAAMRRQEIRRWIDDELRRRRVRLTQDTIDRILLATGGSLGAIHGELDKLAALSADGQPDAEALSALIAGDEPLEVWAVMELLLGPEPARGAAALDRLLGDGRTAQHLIATLGGQVRDLLAAQAHIVAKGSAAGLAAALRVPDWRADRLARQARGVPPRLLASWLHELHDIDRRVKAGEVSDVEALRALAHRAAAGVQASRAA